MHCESFGVENALCDREGVYDSLLAIQGQRSCRHTVRQQRDWPRPGWLSFGKES